MEITPRTPALSETRREVVLCDVHGQPTGSAEIVAAHTGEGQLHLAFSVFVFSPDGRALLIQQRSAVKMLWPLAWANTCCSHPRANEPMLESAQRRLQEEMGFTCDLAPGPEFVYRAVDPQGRGVEHEYDTILLGSYAGEPRPNPAEVAAWKWMDLEHLQRDMNAKPEQYAPWFHLGLARVVAMRVG